MYYSAASLYFCCLGRCNQGLPVVGRTVAYTNTLPRYFLLSVQYRLKIRPKQR